ncbi:MAG: 4-hydroxybenzoate octaprenyltransferase [Bacterioplanes sp.]|nr:4-hydroxybenzoate octaprenyltransferase [Bacterioplanes sp.]
MLWLTTHLDRVWPTWLDWVQLLRLDKPIGTLLLLWPTYWALWLAAEGMPGWQNLIIFTLGVIVMRSAGCVINDYADRHVDGHVKRTQHRPLATGRLSAKHALIGFSVLCTMAFVLVLLTNPLTMALSLIGLVLAAIYPFMKRHTHLPQLFLGAAFSWSIPMAYAAESNELPATLWLLYAANLAWTVAYDTIYAMVDRDDDIHIGVKSTAILFGDLDVFMIALLYALTIVCLWLLGGQLSLSGWYAVACLLGALFMAWQVWQIRQRQRDTCFRVFRASHWFGCIVWLGFIVHYTTA